LSEISELSFQIQSSIKRLLEDPITEVLLNNSHLTGIQLETLLLDLLSENISGIRLSYEQKSKLRLKDNKISRGSYNRTLKQAKNNITKSINTIILLGYIGIFQTTQLQQYIEISKKMNSYVNQYIKFWNKDIVGDLQDQKIKELLDLKNSLINELKSLI